MMGLMNEPHEVENGWDVVLIEWFADSMRVDDIVDIGLWSDTVQTAVTAREVEVTSHYILLPGEASSPPLPYSSIKIKKKHYWRQRKSN